MKLECQLIFINIMWLIFLCSLSGQGEQGKRQAMLKTLAEMSQQVANTLKDGSVQYDFMRYLFSLIIFMVTNCFRGDLERHLRDPGRYQENEEIGALTSQQLLQRQEGQITGIAISPFFPVSHLSLL
jgi:hypothetical protein